MNINMNKIFSISALMLTLFLISEPAMAASSAGGGLPFDSWLTKVSNSITGPFAFAVSLIGIVASGAALIWGGELSGFMKTIIYLVMVLSLIIAGKATLTAITGQGAEITKPLIIEFKQDVSR